MANMSYCRFGNTANDLEDCLEHMDANLENKPSEASARRRIIEMAMEIASEYGHLLEKD